MMNERGEPTFFETLAVQDLGCQPGASVDLHISKLAGDTYWNPGISGAEVHWVMHQNDQGQWHAIASLIHWDDPDPAWNYGKDITVDYIPADDNAYLVVPGLFKVGEKLVQTGYAQWYLDRNHQTTSCLTSGEKGPMFRWTSKLYVEQIQTSAYSGQALVNEEFEGCSSAQQETDDSKACAHEKWYFAPGVGLVAINSIWQNIFIKRVTP